MALSIAVLGIRSINESTNPSRVAHVLQIVVVIVEEDSAFVLLVQVLGRRHESATVFIRMKIVDMGTMRIETMRLKEQVNFIVQVQCTLRAGLGNEREVGKIKTHLSPSSFGFECRRAYRAITFLRGYKHED